MTLAQVKKHFRLSLKNIYPNDEISSIFRMLVRNNLGLNPAEIILERNVELNQKELGSIMAALARLQKKEPIQYILGKTTFCDLEFNLTPDVLIPRPETEELVEWIVQDVKNQNDHNSIQILDIGTGSGCIAISLAKKIKNAEVSALDISEKALHIANGNATFNKTDVRFFKLDILKTKELPRQYDIIVSNPPYVREQEKDQMHENVLKHEPKEALFVDDDNPLLFYERISELAKKYLSKKGILYFETNQYLGKKTSKLLESKGFKNVALRKDFLGKDRMIKASF